MIAVVVALGPLAGVGGYLAGHAGGARLGPAILAGRLAGQQTGRQAGYGRGYAAGLRERTAKADSRGTGGTAPRVDLPAGAAFA